MSGTPFTLAVVPHAPLLLRAVAGDPDPCATSREAVSDLLGELEGPVFVVVSPHADRTGVYGSPAGDLSRFGITGIGVSARTSESRVALARAWGQPLLNDPLDHGALLPMALAPGGSTFVCCGIAESATEAEAVRLGRELAQAIYEVPWEGVVALLASAHSAASLSRRAPLTERREGAEFDQHLLRLLSTQPAALAETDSISAELWSRGGSCSRASFAALGEMARLCKVPSFEILSHEWPVGVGMLVARGVA